MCISCLSCMIDRVRCDWSSKSKTLAEEKVLNSWQENGTLRSSLAFCFNCMFSISNLKLLFLSFRREHFIFHELSLIYVLSARFIQTIFLSTKLRQSGWICSMDSTHRSEPCIAAMCKGVRSFWSLKRKKEKKGRKENEKKNIKEI